MQACVVIPARDEERRIGAALRALSRQRDLGGVPLDTRRFEILLGCNNCRDSTAQIARDFAANRPQVALHVVEISLPRANANVGFARGLLMGVAHRRLGQVSQAQPQAICSTDADSQVFPTWIAATLTEIAAGAEAVGGRITMLDDDAVENDAVGSDFGEMAARGAYERDTTYRLLAARLENRLDPQPADPMPRHFQFFGASLAVTPRAYEQVGGLPRVECLEDVALERALFRADIAIRRSPHVRVSTSARRSGRVATGLSSRLREWNDLEKKNATWLVPSAPELCARWRARRALRTLHACLSSGQLGEAEIAWLSQQLRLNPVWLRSRTHKTPFFGALWSDVERALDANSLFRAQWAPVAVEVAIMQLHALLEGVSDK